MIKSKIEEIVFYIHLRTSFIEESQKSVALFEWPQT